MAMSDRTAEPGLAWQFMKKLSMDKDVQMTILEKSQGFPVRREVVLEAAERDKAEADSPDYVDLEAVSAIMDEAVGVPKFRDHAAAVIMADNGIQEILAGKVPLSNGLHKLQKEINAFLQR